jgi:hypothetical protein
LATYPIQPKRLSAGVSDDQERLPGNLLKLRAVQVLLSTRHGSKGAIARVLSLELRAKGLKASLSSIYFWQRRYLCFGFDGLERRKRNDAGLPRRRTNDRELS